MLYEVLFDRKNLTSEKFCINFFILCVILIRYVFYNDHSIQLALTIVVLLVLASVNKKFNYDN